MEKTDVVAPALPGQQRRRSADPALLRRAQVITHQDLIAYRNPGYFPRLPAVGAHRRLTRAGARARRPRGVLLRTTPPRRARARSSSIPAGAGRPHRRRPRAQPDVAPERPARAPRRSTERPFLLCLGTDFRHKNRVFALRLLEALREAARLGRAARARRPTRGQRLLGRRGGGVSRDAPRARARGRARCRRSARPRRRGCSSAAPRVLYPTTYEGFGLMPFEAADHGRPCLFASHTALAETLPPELAHAGALGSAARAPSASHELLDPPGAVQAQVLRDPPAGTRVDVAVDRGVARRRLLARPPPPRRGRRPHGAGRRRASRPSARSWSASTTSCGAPHARRARAGRRPTARSAPTRQRSLAAVAQAPAAARGCCSGRSSSCARSRGGRPARDAPSRRRRRPRRSRCTSAGRTSEHMREQLAAQAEQPDPEPSGRARAAASAGDVAPRAAAATLARRTPRARRSAAPTRSPAAVSTPAAPEPLAQLAVAEQPRERGARPPRASGSGIRQFSPSTQKSRLPCASVHTTAPPVAIASSGGRQKPSCVEVCTNTVASLNSSLTSSSLGELDVAHARARWPSSGSIPNRHSSGRGSGSARHAVDRQRQVLQRVGAPEREHHVVAALRRPRSGRKRVEVDARRDQLGVEAQLAQPLAVPARRSSCSGTRGGRSRARRGACARRRGSSDVSMSCTKYTGMPRSTLARHTGAAVFHQVATLIASTRRERLDQLVVVLEAVHRRAQLEPVGLRRRACTARPRARARAAG